MLFGRVGRFEQVLSDLKRFRIILVKKLFHLKVFTLLEMRITSKQFSVLFAFFKVFKRFSVFVLFSHFELKRFGQLPKIVFLLNNFSVAIRS